MIYLSSEKKTLCLNRLMLVCVRVRVFFFVAFVRSVLIVTECCLTASYITLYGLHYSTAYECVLNTVYTTA